MQSISLRSEWICRQNKQLDIFWYLNGPVVGTILKSTATCSFVTVCSVAFIIVLSHFLQWCEAVYQGHAVFCWFEKNVFMFCCMQRVVWTICWNVVNHSYQGNVFYINPCTNSESSGCKQWDKSVYVFENQTNVKVPGIAIICSSWQHNHSIKQQTQIKNNNSTRRHAKLTTHVKKPTSIWTWLPWKMRWTPRNSRSTNTD